MATDGGAGHGRQAIGRQIVLPFSKAFEIAWKGIRIRIWRSLITMSGIILAIAFLMSVWASGVFDRAMHDVAEDDELYSVVQGALEAEAIAAGSVRVRCAVVEQERPLALGEVTPGAGIRSALSAQAGFLGERVPNDSQAILDLLGEEDGAPQVLILEGIPAVFAEPGAAAAVVRFVRDGGALLVYGTEGADGDAARALADALPADLAPGTFAVEAAQISAGPRAVALPWRSHPRAAFRRSQGKPQAVELASAEGQALGWSRAVGVGSATWYLVDAASAGEVGVISWFARGQVSGGPPTAEKGSGAPLVRIIVRTAGTGAVERDMRGVWLVTLSLMVCVVGITNAMLMSVTERFREIGTMKCLGALDKFVVKLFLIESSLQGVVGSLAGALIGFLLAFLRALFTFHVRDVETGESYWLTLRFFPALELLGWIAIALAVGIVLSVVAAIYPAVRAARMEPVQAMQGEA